MQTCAGKKRTSVGDLKVGVASRGGAELGCL